MRASVFFLRPAVIESLRRHVKDQLILKRMLDCFDGGAPLAIHAGNSRVRALPAWARLEIMERLKSIAQRYRLEVLVCACKNPDISSGSCRISGRWPPAVRGSCQLGLFPSGQPSRMMGGFDSVVPHVRKSNHT